jgi:hypothetical protein
MEREDGHAGVKSTGPNVGTGKWDLSFSSSQWSKMSMPEEPLWLEH